MTVRDALGDLAAGEHPTVEQKVEEAFELEDEEEVESDAPAPGSILASLRARAQQLAAEKTIDLALPGFGEQLWGRYRAVSLPRALAQANEYNPISPSWTLAADTLCRALEAVYYRDEAGELLPLHPEPVRFDDELAAMLGRQPEARTARAVLVAVLGGGEKAESLIWSHYMAYQGWLMTGEDAGIAQGVADSAVGESSREG